MKINHLLFFFSFNIVLWVSAQDVTRIEVKGQIIANYPDLEGVTVYNLSSNFGTITDSEGKFNIAVAKNDRIEVSALQFEKFTLVVTDGIIVAGSMTIFLVERVNRLNEVLILPYGLSGNLKMDLENTKTVNPNLDAVYFGMANVNEYEFTDDYKTEVENIAMTPEHLQFGANLRELVGLILSPLFKDDREVTLNDKGMDVKLANSKTVEFMMKRLNIPNDEIERFLTFVEDTSFDLTLLEQGRELEFLDLLITQSKIYQNQRIDKD